MKQFDFCLNRLISLSLRWERVRVRTDDTAPPSSSSPRTRKGKNLGWLKALLNPRGLSVLFLVVAMFLMVAIGYVFSYLIPTKQKSLALAVSSNQAFFLAQSGVEFAVRYATENNWTTPLLLNNLDNRVRTLGPGNFILDYDESNDRLISTGQILNISQRRVVVSNFTQFLPQSGLILWTPPCRIGNTQIRFIIKNVGSSTLTLNRFSATWTNPPNNREITTITFGSSTAFSGIYNYPNCAPCIRNLTQNQTVIPNQTITVQVTWDQNIMGQLPVVISFWDTSGTQFQFILQPIENC